MYIEKKIKNHLVFSGDSILDALNKINVNKSRIVFVVQDNGVLLGSLSDGDIRRWITQNNALDLNLPVDQAMNRNFIAKRASDSAEEISKSFDAHFEIIPLTDELGRFVALAHKSKIGFQVGNFIVSDKDPTFVIAEIGNNHQGDLSLAKDLVDMAIEAKADCVKFQMRNLASLYSNRGKNAEANYDLGSQYTLNLLNKFQLTEDELFQVFDYCKLRGIFPMCTPWDIVSARALNEYGLEAFKVASADFTNFEMLEFLAETGKPLICSTGMSRESEIISSVALLKEAGASFALLHCNSTYPTPFKDVNLSYLSRLKEISDAVVGYSGHERGYAVPIAAVAIGARIVEKHFTINQNLEGSDHKISLLPEQFSEMVRQIRNVEESIGHSGERVLTQGELINRENLAKSLMINCDLKKGEVIQRSMISIKSPGQGIQPNKINELIGKKALRDLSVGDVFFESDLSVQSTKKNRYVFNRPYGIPVRYHDYASLIGDVNLDFVEFHLSYHDLDLNLSDYFHEPLSIGYAVHSPELFAGDHILDLANKDKSYREISIQELKRTIAISEKLQRYFPSTDKPVLVLNAGGWTTSGFLPVEKRAELYERVYESLCDVDLSQVKLAIQTMPPFPWHFGGQSYHNIFIDPDEIATFCERTGLTICLDVSHSMMACNYFKWDFSEFLKKVLPHTVHLHIVDAKGVDGEGVQMGCGDVDFLMLRDLIGQYAPNVQFIPEVWQGHKNKGSGFWAALQFLEEKNY